MISSRKFSFWLTIVGSFFVTVFSTRADLSDVLPQMGDLERWAVFSLGNGPSGDQLSRNAYIKGDVGMAGNGNVTLRGSATIEGSLYYRSNGALRMFGNAKITGARYHSEDSQLDNGASEAIDSSNAAFALAPTSSYTTINLRGSQSAIITGAPGATVVLTLRNFMLRGNATFTLEGTATTKFIINVTKQFSLSGSAKIVLSGGVTWNNVLFNVRGRGRATLSAYSSFNGILMANDRKVVISGHSTVTGAVIANKIVLSGSSQIIHPPITSP